MGLFVPITIWLAGTWGMTFWTGLFPGVAYALIEGSLYPSTKRPRLPFIELVFSVLIALATLFAVSLLVTIVMMVLGATFNPDTTFNWIVAIGYFIGMIVGDIIPLAIGLKKLDDSTPPADPPSDPPKTP